MIFEKINYSNGVFLSVCFCLCYSLDERQDVQKKTFTKWINSQLSKTECPIVNDLFEDLRDGHKLLTLLEILTNQKYVSFICFKSNQKWFLMFDFRTCSYSLV